MRIGFDVDGVLADFCPAYMDLFIRLTGRNDFHVGDRRDPPDWNWPTTRSYTKAETDAVWGEIKQSSTFWLNLGEDRACPTLRTMIQGLEHDHDVYFLTTRVGVRAKRQTEIWLWDHLGYHRLQHVTPTVGVAAYRQKGHLVKGLGLDVFIDDNVENCNDIAEATTPIDSILHVEERRETGTLYRVESKPPTCRVYLLNRAYNREAADLDKHVVRVDSLGEMFDAEIRAGYM